MSASPALKEIYKVDVKICYPFIEAIINTLKVQCNLVATVGKPSFKEPQVEDHSNILIQATIADKQSLASVTICISNKVFFAIMGRMLGETFTKMTADLEDGAKELMNIIFNQAKKALAQKGIAAIRSIPTVVFGENIRVRYLTRGQPIIIPFDSEIGHFSVEISAQDLSVSDSV